MFNPAAADAWASTESYVQMVEQKGGQKPQQRSEGIFVRFFKHPVLNAIKSYGGKTVLVLRGKDDDARLAKAKEIVEGWGCGAKLLEVGGRVDGMDHFEVEVEGAGRPIFDEEDYVFIATPGDPSNIVKRPVWKDAQAEYSDVNRFPDHWKAYREGSQQKASGTPIEHWGVLTLTQVAELKALHITTVEAVANLSDEVTGRYMGFNSLKHRAQAWLDAAKGNAGIEKLAADKRQLESELDALKRQVAEMQKLTEKAAKTK